MINRVFGLLTATIISLTAVPSGAEISAQSALSASASDNCEGFTLNVAGSGLSKPSKVDYTIDLAPASGSAQQATGSIRVSPDSNGDFSAHQTRKWTHFGSALHGRYRLSGTAELAAGSSTVKGSLDPPHL